MLAEEAGHTGDLQKRLDAKVGELESAKRALESKKCTLKEKSCENGCLEIETEATPATIGREERVTHDLTERVCTGYISVMRA